MYPTLYQFSHAAAFTSMPDADAMSWLSDTYAGTFDKLYKPLWGGSSATSTPWPPLVRGLPQPCQVCQVPMLLTEPGDPTTLCQRDSVYKGEKFQTCSNGCRWIFEREPEKYVQVLAARAPDLPGQLRRTHGARRSGLYPSRRRRWRVQRAQISTTSTGTRGTTHRTTPTSDRRAEHHGPQEHRNLPTFRPAPDRNPPGTTSSSTSSFQEDVVLRRGLLPALPRRWAGVISGTASLCPSPRRTPTSTLPSPGLDAARRGVPAARRPDPRGDRRRPQGRHRDAGRRLTGGPTHATHTPRPSHPHPPLLPPPPTPPTLSRDCGDTPLCRTHRLPDRQGRGKEKRQIKRVRHDPDPRITIEPLGREVESAEARASSDACLRSGVWLPHSCTHGTCATCKADGACSTVRWTTGRRALVHTHGLRTPIGQASCPAQPARAPDVTIDF